MTSEQWKAVAEEMGRNAEQMEKYPGSYRIFVALEGFAVAAYKAVLKDEER